MDSEVKNLLIENVKFSKENNVLLLKLYRIQRWNQITNISYWVFIILITVGAFHFLQPYLGNLINMGIWSK